MSIEVTLPPARDLALPTTCACCGLPGQHNVCARRGVMAEASFLLVPVCAGCYRHAFGAAARLYKVLGVAMLSASGVGALTAFKAPLPLSTLVVVSTLLATVAGASAAYFVATRAAKKEGCSTHGSPVVETALGEGGATFYCTHEGWARELSELSGGSVAKARRPARGARRLSIVAAAALSGAAAAGGVARLIYSPLYVDNGHLGPLDVYVDGKYEATVPPTYGQAPLRVWVRSGERRLAFAAAGEPPGDARQTAASLTSGGALYNPAAAACHFRSVVYYGYGGVGGDEGGPLPRREVITDGVDDWFRDPPNRLKVDSRSSVVKRVALLRHPACTELARRGCPDEVTDAYARCVQEAAGRQEHERCFETARLACESAPRRESELI